MKRLLTILALFVCAGAFAQNQVQTETSNQINSAAGKVMQLAEAIPAEKYNWSPEEGVRSIAGVIGHVISVNYFFAMKLGATIPEGVNPQTIEQDITTKEALIPALKQSTELIVSAVTALDNSSLANKIEFPFPGEYTTLSAILIAQGHCNEHLGQLIAYGRMNGIAPPWSQQ